VNTSHVIGGVIPIGLLVFSAVMASSQEDPESVSAMLDPRGERLIIARCAVCHSADLITQQRLSRTRWQATIDKMKHWGAEISDQEADLLIGYLSARFPPNAPANVPPLSHEIGKGEPLKQEPQAPSPVIGSRREEQESSSTIARPVMDAARWAAWDRGSPRILF
jgi:cytochrome c oxidase cbb3-type subunit 3